MLDEISNILSHINEGSLEKLVQMLVESKSVRIWIAGNGGSASTAIHFASDLKSLGFDVSCLDENISRITAITNDYGWDKVYEYQMKYFKAGDILVVFSVHGGTIVGNEVWSGNLVRACEIARSRHGSIIAFLGGDGGIIGEKAYLPILIPSNQTYIIEGLHCVLTHAICEKLRGERL
jgi:D-sedoheptulose 7-phosphate isomerase